MGKHASLEDKFKSYEPLYPNIRLLTFERGRRAIRNLYNSKTHHSKPPVRHDGEASAILDCLESYARERHKIIELSADEANNAQKLGLVPEGARVLMVKRPWPKKAGTNGQH
jgi:hypothetical protein